MTKAERKAALQRAILTRLVALTSGVGKVKHEGRGPVIGDFCRRTNGTLRAHFETREQAEAFAAHPANHEYHGDVAHKCLRCPAYHLSRPEWLVPNWSRNTTGKRWN